MSYEVPRESIPWFPTVDTDLCAGCEDCFDFCASGVYEWDDQWGFPIVTNPYNCVVGCQACGKLCATEAITFPDRDEINALVQRLREAHAASAEG